MFLQGGQGPTGIDFTWKDHGDGDGTSQPQPPPAVMATPSVVATVASKEDPASKLGSQAAEGLVPEQGPL
jgi:hypothetical protein